MHVRHSITLVETEFETLIGVTEVRLTMEINRGVV